MAAKKKIVKLSPPMALPGSSPVDMKIVSTIDVKALGHRLNEAFWKLSQERRKEILDGTLEMIPGLQKIACAAGLHVDLVAVAAQAKALAEAEPAKVIPIGRKPGRPAKGPKSPKGAA